jgi:hypothetical protein
MIHNTRNLAITGALAALTAGLLLATSGCAERRPPDELAMAVAMGERPVAMKGSGTFFGGKIGATITISRGIGRGVGRAPGGGRRNDATRGELPDLSGMDNDEASAYIRAKVAVGSPLPPVTMHLKLENNSKETVSVEIGDFESDLGNFAVHPETLAMAPDQISEPDPMISQLGVTSDEIPVKVTLKLGTAKETQTIVVRSVAPTPQGK